jgi:mono/diheme cytochrome c family protein
MGAKRPLFLGVVLLFAAFLAGCANGTYPLDIFYEMHYQQSYGAHEPPRISVPEGAVPITGRQLSTTENLIPGQRVEEGARLFANNCAFCHGTSGKGDGPVLRVMRDKYNYPQSNPGGQYPITPDLTSDFVNVQPDVAIYAWITNGVTVMPSFNKLLTVEERWLVVNYIRTLPQ